MVKVGDVYEANLYSDEENTKNGDKQKHDRNDRGSDQDVNDSARFALNKKSTESLVQDNRNEDCQETAIIVDFVKKQVADDKKDSEQMGETGSEDQTPKEAALPAQITDVAIYPRPSASPSPSRKKSKDTKRSGTKKFGSKSHAVNRRGTNGAEMKRFSMETNPDNEQLSSHVKALLVYQEPLPLTKKNTIN